MKTKRKESLEKLWLQLFSIMLHWILLLQKQVFDIQDSLDTESKKFDPISVNAIEWWKEFVKVNKFHVFLILHIFRKQSLPKTILSFIFQRHNPVMKPRNGIENEINVNFSAKFKTTIPIPLLMNIWYSDLLFIVLPFCTLLKCNKSTYFWQCRY